MVGITIQINSKEALARLLGEDSELHVQVRNSIADDFLKNHLHPLLTEPKVAAAKTEIVARIDAAIKEALCNYCTTAEKNYYGVTTGFKLSPEIASLVDKQVVALIKTEAMKLTENYAKELEVRLDSLFKQEEARLTRFITDSLNKMIQTAISKQLEELMKPIAQLATYYKQEVDSARKERKIELTL